MENEGPLNGGNRDHLRELAEKVSSALDADIIAYDGGLESPVDDVIIDKARTRTRRTNVLLVIHTHGGSADVAYRIARCLQRKYEHFLMYVNACSKSAGTLLAVGADELIIPDHGQLGPLDVQLAKPDELGEMSSGLTLWIALNSLQEKAFALWEHFFLTIKQRSGGQITSKSASEIAASITGSLFTPIYAQVEPSRLGEVDRAVRISSEYGDRIARNLKEGALERLVADYPSHEFVIDREEARDLFERVREPTEDELALADEISRLPLPTFMLPYGQNQPLPVFIDEVIATEEKGATHERQSNTDGASDSASPVEGPSSIPTDGETPAITGRSRGKAGPKSGG